MNFLISGTSRVDITPPIGITHANWGAQTHQVSTHNDMPLYVTAAYFQSDKTKMTIIDVDILVITNEKDQEIRSLISDETGVPFDNIRLSYSHTHSGPVAYASDWHTEGNDLVKKWLASIGTACLKAVRLAIENAQPSVTKFSRGSCEINANRRPTGPDGRLFTGRNVNGFVIRDVDVIGVDDLNGSPVATIVNYACHPTIMGHENTAVTPDFPGPMRKLVESTVGGTCLFLQGASGNIGPFDGFTGDLGVYRKAGKILGAEVAKLRLEMDFFPERDRSLKEIIPSGANLGIYKDDPTTNPDASLKVSNVSVDLPCRELPDLKMLEEKFERLRKKINLLNQDESSPEKLKLEVSNLRKINISINVVKNQKLVARNGFITMRVQAIRIGDAVLVSMPVEPFAEIASSIKAQSPFDNLIVSGFSNGHNAYLPTTEAYEEGGYEVDVTPFSPGSDQLAVSACLNAVSLVE